MTQTISALPDGKLYFKIGEVARICGVEPYVLRFWETEFRQIAPQKGKSQQRMYSRATVELLLTIKDLLYQQKFTIEGARRQLKAIKREKIDANSSLQLPLALSIELTPKKKHLLEEVLLEIQKFQRDLRDSD